MSTEEKIEKLREKRRTLYVRRVEATDKNAIQRIDQKLVTVNRNLYLLTNDPVFNVNNKKRFW